MSPIGISGFGRTVVYGRRRCPLPPARITARIPCPSASLNVVDVGFVPLAMPPDPVDRARETFFQRDTRRPADDAPCLAVVAQQSLHLAAGWAYAGRVFDDFG